MTWYWSLQKRLKAISYNFCPFSSKKPKFICIFSKSTAATTQLTISSNNKVDSFLLLSLPFYGFFFRFNWGIQFLIFPNFCRFEKEEWGRVNLKMNCCISRWVMEMLRASKLCIVKEPDLRYPIKHFLQICVFMLI